MKSYLGSTDLAIWVILTASKLVLCLCILKKHFFGRLPLFSALAFFSFVKCCGLFVIAFWANYAAYYYAYYISGYVESALVFLTLIECGRQVLPGLDLPQKEKAFAWLFAALAGVVAFAVLWPLRSIANEKRIEVGSYLAIAVTFIFIAAYSRYLGLNWSRLLAGISTTLGMLCLVHGATKAITGHYPLAIVQLVSQISTIANILAVIAWIVVILSPWGERELTEEGLKKIEAAFARIEASLGAGKVGTL
jgi:hypothetical protein